ncbi:MAG: metalloregulator ArsR/SmtB family transcription factor [Anaerolineaceae bacterium]|nr:metalloregulator ArsR/SmtB family transcription factor [Anaerolineaceae bacterium]
MLSVNKTAQPADLDVYAAISHPVRRQLLDMLRDKEQSVKELSEPFDMSRPAISQHLRILLDVGLVSEQRNGRERHYQLHSEGLMEVQRWLATYQRFWQDRLGALGNFLEEKRD